MTQQKRFQYLEQVRVKPATGFHRLLPNQFRNQWAGHVGTIVLVDDGFRSGRPLYTVLLGEKTPACFFEDELESVSSG